MKPIEAEAQSGYQYPDAATNCSHRVLLPGVDRILAGLALPKGARIFDLDCGNGSTAHHLTGLGYEVVGVDPSAEAIAQAQRAYPHIKLQAGNAYDDLAALYGTFPIVLSLEVVEHVFYPRKYAAAVYNLLEPGGTALISTPYHGYWKNLVLALTGKMDAHFTALWDYGHIKFWSIQTLNTLLREVGFTDIRYTRVGRVPALACSMIAVARKP